MIRRPPISPLFPLPAPLPFLFGEMGVSKVWDPPRIHLVIDHTFPAADEKVANLHHLMRDFAKKHGVRDRKSTRLNSSHSQISYAVFCLKKKKDHHHFTSQISY